jgi:hypothetical protein
MADENRYNTSFGVVVTGLAEMDSERVGLRFPIQQNLYFFPLPQGQSSLRPSLGAAMGLVLSVRDSYRNTQEQKKFRGFSKPS